MSEWFTVEKIDSQTFAISEYKHWEETHCYLLCGEESAVLIDTGLGVSNIREIVDSLTKLPVMVVTTHIHWDHIGGHKYFDNIEYPEEYFDKTDEEFEELLHEAPTWLGEIIKTTAMAMIRAENYPSISKIILIDKILGTCIKDFL